MLSEIRIRNFAIIEAIALPLAPGFNVLSGETGAGKSIIVGALAFLLGERGSTDVIRPGADRAVIEGIFEVAGAPDVAAWADEHGIDVEDGTLVLKREMAANGRGRAWANSTPVGATLLAEVGRMLVNLHGQHEAQTLLDGDSQRAILDAFAGAGDTVSEVRGLHGSLGKVRREMEELVSRRADAEKRADYLRHVAGEIEAARLIEGEQEKLEDEARVLENADELRTLAAALREALEADEGGALQALASAQRSLSAIGRIDPSTKSMQEQLDVAYYALTELAREAGLYAERVELDPERLTAVRERRDLLYRLLKKYGESVVEVIETGRRARAELDLVEGGELDLNDLRGRAAELERKLQTAAAKLSRQRQAAASKLVKAVDARLPELGMPDGAFSVMLPKLSEPGPHGAEDVAFHVSLNKGHPPRPLARVASGGELSRVMLALKTILAKVDRTPTLVFDEVDAGIGGKVGLQVGDTLRRVADNHQVFAISHLPQLAARAHHHIVVAKAAKGGVTTADVTVLTGAPRVEEIARMLGGDPTSTVAKAHAKELLATGIIQPGPSC
ncbi:MAG: DNA repair protein RecN [Gemmatimonadaceae bacterium]